MKNTESFRYKVDILRGRKFSVEWCADSLTSAEDWVSNGVISNLCCAIPVLDYRNISETTEGSNDYWFAWPGNFCHPPSAVKMVSICLDQWNLVLQTCSSQFISIPSQFAVKFKNYCKICGWLMLSKRLLAALALIIVHSVYKGQLVRALVAPLVMRMCTLSRGVAYVW